MRYTLKVIIIGLIILFPSFVIIAQETVSVAGGELSGSGGAVNYTIGQTFYTVDQGVGGSVSKGVQQPYEISKIGIDDTPGINLDIHAYPNPTTDYLILQMMLNILHYQILVFNFLIQTVEF